MYERMTRAQFLRSILSAVAAPLVGGSMLRAAAQMKSATVGPVDPNQTGGHRGSVTVSVVVMQGGKRVSGAEVTVKPKAKDGMVSNGTGSTGADGSFSVALATDHYYIFSAMKDGKTVHATKLVTAKTEHILLTLP